MNEQILINYTKTDDSFLLSIIADEQVICCYNEETAEAVAIINQIKNIIE